MKDLSANCSNVLVTYKAYINGVAYTRYKRYTVRKMCHAPKTRSPQSV